MGRKQTKFVDKGRNRRYNRIFPKLRLRRISVDPAAWGLACPYGAMGYGTFSCVKDNVNVVSTEKVNAEGIVESSNTFTVGKQTIGYDVEIAKAGAQKE